MIPTLALFLACWAACMLVAASILARSHSHGDWRICVLLGSVIGGCAIVLITEALSLFGVLARWWLVAAWTAAVALAVAVAAKLLRHTDLGPGVALRRLRPAITPDLTRLEIGMLALIAAQAVLLGMVALLYPPNNYDSMAYHLARIMHWEQQHSVAFYPSAVMMQTRGAPFAEYAIAQALLVSGGDRFANLVQWYAMAVSAIAGSVVAAELGGDRLRQIAAALLCVSIPMGILQATSTQNDYVVAAWLVTFVAFALRFVRAPADPIWMWAMAAALGLAIATKQTALAYAPPFCVAVGCAALLVLRARAFAAGAVICAIVAALNAGFMLRTTLVVGSPVGGAEAYANEQRSTAVTISNAIRALALNLSMPADIPVLRETSVALRAVLEKLNARTGVDPASAAASLSPANSAFAEPFRLHEDLTGNFLHTLLAAAAVGVCAVSLMRRGGRGSDHPAARNDVLVILGSLVVGYLFFAYYFKWQVWQTRLQLPQFVVAAPVLAVVLFARSRRLIAATALLAGIVGFVWTFGNETRPVSLSMPLRQADRTRWYFANRPDLVEVLPQMAAAIAQSGCRRIGLRIGVDPFEYPLWVLLRDAGVRPAMRHLEFHYLVPWAPSFEPCAVVSAGAEDPRAGVTPQRFGPFYLHLLTAATGS